MRKRPALGVITVTVGCIACSSPSSPSLPSARAVIEARSGSSASGTATFTERPIGVVIEIEVAGVPSGTHGVHVHTAGDCSAADASSAGPHFNPGNHAHGGPGSAAHHAGDLGNMVVGANGTGRIDLLTQDLTVSAGPASVMGRSIVIHAAADDLTTQPSGNSGARIACGVIR